MMTKTGNRPRHLYLHVPFCRSLCYYCDFVHAVYRDDMAVKWLAAVRRETEARDLPDTLDTIYIGGGTPTSLTAGQLDELLSMLDGRSPAEYTIEVNPGTLDEEKADLLVRHGINRVSIGMQTADDALLKAIGRRHSHADTVRTVRLLQAKGIRNISLDLMYSLPGQTMDILKGSVQAAIALDPKHISVYSLTIEENTVFGRKGVQPLDEDTEADMYEYIRDALPAYGFRRYETANFAREGFESRHNLCYWNYRDFYGISAGASGKEGMCRYDHTRDLREYLADPLKRYEIPLSKEDAMFEAVMMNLRKRDGLVRRDFEEMFGMPVTEAFGEKLAGQVRAGLLILTDERLYCSDRGYDLLNTVLTELL